MSLICFIISTVLFVLAGFEVKSDFDFVVWGLAFLAGGHALGGINFPVITRTRKEVPE